MGLILMIETATPVCSVALGNGNDLLKVKEEIRGEASHNALLNNYIQTIFENTAYNLTDIDAIAISGGPGSYTGLRIGCSTAKGLAFGFDKPLLSINTLKALAWKAIQKCNQQEGYYIPLIDARGMGAYTTVYDHTLTEIAPITLQKVNENTFKNYLHKPTWFFGTGVTKYVELMEQMNNASILNDLYCSAKNMMDLAQNAFASNAFEDIAYYEPTYLSKYIPHISNKGKI